jgi:hypothetical protein
VMLQDYTTPTPRGGRARIYQTNAFQLPVILCTAPEDSHYAAREVLRAGVWRKEIGEPSWKPLDRATVETLIGEPLDEG